LPTDFRRLPGWTPHSPCSCFGVEVEVVAVERRHVAAAEFIEHPEAEADTPMMLACRLQEPGHVLGVPGVDLLELRRLGDGSGSTTRAAGLREMISSSTAFM
jgi:hypothetical protein